MDRLLGMLSDALVAVVAAGTSAQA
jgi:hypothetical protein